MTTELKEHVCPPDHKHGQTGTCYAGHGCRCEACRAEHRRSAHALRRAKLYGRYVPPDLVDAEPAREHVRRISEFGIGMYRLAGIANVSQSSVKGLMYGPTGKNHPRHRVLPERINRETARRILSVKADTSHLASGTPVPARGTRRRLQALMRLGWSQRALAVQLAMSNKQLSRMLLHGESVTVRIHERVSDLFDALWDQAPPQSTKLERMAYTRSVNHATARGWQPPLAWDDIDLDDRPAEVLHKDTVDEMAVELAVAGEAVRLSQAERRLAVRELHTYGLTDPQIAERLHCSDQTVLRDRRELDLPSNDDVYNPKTAASAAA
ncbi:hypothetical protein NY057_05090 [Curtobacterium flaccumfaciens]|uniref:hypothetical protein n=1 Tax=Curtobacterium flaccumfaciens TaxID=2035 RepID=UPI002204DBF8|nr:hypothetical protein [Curtobacterium flaccumfaciens]UWD83621.1 hypothetical protein NY057_05090 [Curtobacterium flaccumfaciens]